MWAGRASAKVHLGWRQIGLRPGLRVRLQGQAGLWKVERWTLDRMVVSLELAGVPGGLVPDHADASPGRPVFEADAPHGPTTLRLFDLPLNGDRLAERPHLLVVAGGGVGWRRAALSASFDGGASWREEGSTAPPAVMGSAVTVLAPGGSALFDTRGSVEVELLNDAMWLEGRSDDALVGGANLAVLGEELIQFGAVEPLGGRRFRLSRITRGRRGTEWAAAGHAAGEAFALIEQDRLAVIEPPVSMLGGDALVMASGIGDEQPAEASRTVSGEAVRPPSPVHVTVERKSGGDIAIGWVRRSRSGWAWLDGSDTPLAEESEAYRLVLAGPGFERIVTLHAPTYVYTTAEQLADGLAGALTVSVTQIGTIAPSRTAQRLVSP